MRFFGTQCGSLGSSATIDRMARTPVTTRNNAELGRVEALAEGEVVGYSEYKQGDEGVLVFHHTVVDDDREGEGIGGQLAEGVIRFVRDGDARIAPECSFVRAYMARHEETQDLLAEGFSVEPDGN